MMTILELVEEYFALINPSWSTDECLAQAYAVYHDGPQFNEIVDELLRFKAK